MEQTNVFYLLCSRGAVLSVIHQRLKKQRMPVGPSNVRNADGDQTIFSTALVRVFERGN